MTDPGTAAPTPGDSARPPGGASYAAAGVDIRAGERAVELIRASVATTWRPEVVGSLGGFAGLFDATALRSYDRPLLATATDGVGTKVAIAQELGVHDTIGFDLVGMVVDDLVVCGAEPLFMTDYICAGRVVPETVAAIVAGIAAACAEVGTALVGGETAEHPGLLAPDSYDLAGAATGVVEAAAQLGPERVRAGDVLVAMASSGLHSNGYSLVRHVLGKVGWSYEREVAEIGRPLGAELLTPTRIYAAACLDLLDALGCRRAAGGVHAFAHITGGGLAANLDRVLPAGLGARIERDSWAPPPIFGLIQGLGRIPDVEAELTFNLGIGMVAVLASEVASATLGILERHRLPAWICGSVVEDRETALVGRYRG